NETAAAEQARRVASLVGEGQRAVQARQFDAAIRAFDAVLAIEDNHAGARDGRAQAERGRRIDELLVRAGTLAKTGQAAEAAAMYRQVLDLDPQNTAALAALAPRPPIE